MTPSPAAVAVAVIRDNIRPKLPDTIADTEQEYVELMQSCWHEDPTVRPTFLEIMTRLSSFGDGISRSSYTSGSSRWAYFFLSISRLRVKSSSFLTFFYVHSSSSHGSFDQNKHSSYGAGTSGSSSGGGSSSHHSKSGGAAVGIRAPEGEVVIVFSDITRAASLWEHDAAAMRDATSAHNELLRLLAKKYNGYEAGVGRERNTGEGSFCLIFVRAFDALRWCTETQNALLSITWPQSLLEHPGAIEEHDVKDERVIFRGLRVRMGVHAGHPRVARDAITRRVQYIGPSINEAARMTALSHGGQVVVSQQVRDKLSAEAAGGNLDGMAEMMSEKRMEKLGNFKLPDALSGTLDLLYHS